MSLFFEMPITVYNTTVHILTIPRQKPANYLNLHHPPPKLCQFYFLNTSVMALFLFFLLMLFKDLLIAPEFQCNSLVPQKTNCLKPFTSFYFQSL